MNSAYIFKLIRPFVRSDKLTYDDFDKIFGFLPRKEQYSIADTVQDVLNIELVDEITDLPDEIPPPVKNPARDIKMPDKLLIRMIQDGDEQAKRDFCIKNSALVEKCAIKYRENSSDKFALEDLIQAGNFGLIAAAEDFSFDKETDLNTFLVSRIEKEILRLISPSK